jgi:hypothetical protein
VVTTLPSVCICESLKDLISKVGKNKASTKEHEMNYKNTTFIMNLVDVFITLGG